MVVPREGFAKFGKLPARRDPRNFKAADLLQKVTPPAAYDFDVTHGGIPTPMFGNDYHGDCVIAGRAHQTLRFEDAEKKKILKITDADVLAEWHKENGNTEDGLVILDSLNLWRKRGWKAAGKTYKIKAFAEINRANHTEAMVAVFSDIGIMLGMSLPDSCIDQFNAAHIWDDISQPPNPENGHCVYVPGYNATGPVCVTWGRKQQMTWAYFDKYCDEAYAIIDAKDTSILGNILNKFLEAIGATA